MFAIDQVDADLARLDAREARLVQELDAVRLEKQKIQHFREVAGRYAGWGAEPISQLSRIQTTFSGKGKLAGAPRAGSKSARVVDAALAAVDAAGGKHLQIIDLLKAVQERGLTVGGQKEAANLAGFLSRDPRIVYERPHGWKRAGAPTQKDETVGLAPKSTPTVSGVSQASPPWPPTVPVTAPSWSREPETGGGTR